MKIYLFGEVDGGMCFFTGLDPLSIEVCSWQIASIIANDNSIDIEHRNYFENKVLT